MKITLTAAPGGPGLPAGLDGAVAELTVRPDGASVDAEVRIPAGEQDDLANRFTYHPPSGDQPGRYEKIRGRALDYARLIDDLVPAGREKSLALTALEQAVMWANAGIARA